MIKKKLLKTIALTGIALLVNIESLPLVFDSVNILLGGFLTYFVLEAFGFPYALIVATGIAVQRTVLYSDPAGGLITLIELAGVYLIRLFSRQHIIISGWIFWTFIGWIVYSLVITHFINLENTTSLALVLKEAVNGLINITLGSILYILYLYYFNREKSISYSDIIFVFLTGASIIPMFFKALYQADSEERFMLSKVKEDIAIISESIQDSVSHWINIHKEAVKELANRLEIWGPKDVEQLQRETETIRRSFGQFHACYIADENAKAITFYPDINPEGRYMPGTIFSYREYYKKVKETLKPSFTEVLIARFALKPVVGIAVPAIKEGKFLGYAYCGLKLSKLKHLMEDFSLKKGVYITLLDKDGKVIASNFPGLKPMDRFKGIYPLRQIGDLLIVSKEDVRHEDRLKIDTYQRAYFYKHQTLRGDTGWIVVMEVSLLPYVRGMFNRMILNFLLIYVFTVVVFLISKMLTSIAVEPVKKLSDYVLSLSKDIEHQPKVEIPKTNIVEISSLAHAFKEMAQKILTYVEELRRMAYFDHLTGLPNRTLLKDRIERAIRKARRNKLKVSVFFIDIDHFKTINDTLGHDFGDILLKQVANRLSGIFRESDTVARFGGDEFVAVVQDIKDIQDAVKVADQVLKLFETPFYVEKQEVFLSASIGIAVYPDNGETPSELIKNADIAMYKAKEEGKNNFAFFSPELNRRAIEILTMKNKLHKAIERKEFILHFQPIYSLPDMKLNGVEALIRWKSPEDGLVPPSKFINILEELGLIREVGKWVMEETFKLSKEWEKYNIFINVNVSPRQFMDRSFVKNTLEISHRVEAQKPKIVLEITETSLMKNPEESINILKRLKSHGFLIAVDDFGTGYSSLSYLKQLPLDVIKIDMSFVRNIPQSHIDRSIVSTIIELSKSLGLKSLAEGVETKEQLNILVEMGCELAQGYLFGKPMPKEEIERLIRKEKGL